MLGFLPLRSYFLTKKQPEMCGKKCPADIEDIVRCFIFKDALELLRCTYGDLEIKVAKKAILSGSENDVE